MAQSLGAEKKERVEEAAKKGMLVMALLMTPISLLLVLIRFPVFGFFIKDQPDVVRKGGQFLLIPAVGTYHKQIGN
ncbi:MAG: MATE family efflux transporter [Thermoplasmata archaeon]